MTIVNGISMGPHFNAAPTTIARKRLPAGLVAILNNPGVLCAAIAELHAYANTNRMNDRPRRGIVFRVIEEWERRSIVHKLWNFFGTKNAPENEHKFNVPIGHMHTIDDSAVSHACNRHGLMEGKNQHLVLTVLDFQRIPEVVNPRYISEFSVAKGMPRMVYRKQYDGFTLVVVQELQQQTGLLIKTVYKQK
jgi:phage-Barnase-EndoU-ColicinE5/D-RelE like nuclease3